MPDQRSPVQIRRKTNPFIHAKTALLVKAGVVRRGGKKRGEGVDVPVFMKKTRT